MPSKEMLKLIAGFRNFREKYYSGDRPLFQQLSTGQKPKTLVIACSDSRVDPSLMSSADPGELFVIRNVANLVPPFESTESGFHGVSAAIEFSVVNLKVENIVVLGHRQCGGIRALIEGQQARQGSFVGRWMEIARPARERTLSKASHLSFEEQCKTCETESIITSLDNLRTFPFVEDALKHQQLKIYGIYFDLEKGELHQYEEALGQFVVVDTTAYGA